MGNREKLLVAARRCVLRTGFNATTARDIATEAGVSLAAIGYHFRSTEALLTQAVIDGIGEWGEAIGGVLGAVATAQAPPLERFEAVWSGVIATMEDHRGVLAASFEVMARTADAEPLRTQLADAVASARLGLAQMFLGIDPEQEPERARIVGSFYYAILSGLITQWLLDPDRAPSGADLAAALTEVVADAAAAVRT